MEILGSWVVVAARAAIFPRTSRGSTGRECARLNVEHSSLWPSLNLELFGLGEMDECDSDSSGHSTIPLFCANELMNCFSKQGQRRLFPIGPWHRRSCAEAPDGGGTERQKDCPRRCWSAALFGCYRLRTGLYWPPSGNYKPEHIVQALCSFTAMALVQIRGSVLPQREFIYRHSLCTSDLCLYTAYFILYNTFRQGKFNNVSTSLPMMRGSYSIFDHFKRLLRLSAWNAAITFFLVWRFFSPAV